MLIYVYRVTLELSCDMDMHNYPHDTQICGVSIMARK